MMYGLGDIDFMAIQRAQSPTLEQDARRVIKLAEYSAVTVVVLQAVAAFSALALAAIAVKQYSDKHKSGKRRSSQRRTR